MTQRRPFALKSKPTPRRRGPVRPRFDALEGRALMATTAALDPTFGVGGILASTTGGTANGTAIAVQSDGKIVEINPGESLFSILEIRRYNSNGTVDTSFGTGGVTSIPTPTSPALANAGFLYARSPRNLAIGADGSISFATPLTYAGVSIVGGLVARLTPTGQLDSSFGTGGEVLLTTPNDAPDSVALDSNGNLLVLGTDSPGDTGGYPQQNLFVARYTSAGVLDTSFAGDGRLEVGPEFLPGGAATVYVSQPAGIAVGSGGQIYAAGFVSTYLASSPPTNFLGVVSITANGTLDPAFGGTGTKRVATPPGSSFTGSLALQPDGGVLLAGPSNDGGTGFLTRILPDGTTDAAFGARATFSKGLGGILATGSGLVVGADGRITLGLTRLITNGNSRTDMVVLARYLTDGTPDLGFGIRGQYAVPLGNQALTGQNNCVQLASLALAPAGSVIVLGQQDANYYPYLNLLASVRPVAVAAPDNDYDGDGNSDIAAYLTAQAGYAIRPSSGSTGDVIRPYGQAGVGASIPAPGDYDGSGYTEMAVYTPSTGYFYYRPAAGGPDIGVAFGSAGAGASIPATADYDGDGITDLAVYLPQYAGFAVRPSTGAAPYFAQIGGVGARQSVPAPGDYDGDGKADLAVYLPQYGILAYRPSSGGADVLTSFGAAGVGNSIPAPGDYDGDGKTDIAAYLPQYALYAYRPSSGGSDVLRSFGAAGAGNSIPAPGDYDGDGSTDLAVYLPQYAVFAYRPSSAIVLSSDVLTSFGTPGPGATVPTASISYAQPPSVSSSSLAATAGPDVPLALTDDVLAELAGLAAKKRRI